MSSDPPSDEQLAQDILSATSIEIMESPNANSHSSRSPSLYDLHLPNQLKLRMLKLGISSPIHGDVSSPILDTNSEEARPLKHLFQRPTLVEFLRGTRGVNLRQKWSVFLDGLSTVECINEESVVVAETIVSMVVAQVMALAVVNLSEVQIERLGRWQLLHAYPSLEKETKSDILFGLYAEDSIKKFDAKLSNIVGYEAIWPLVQGLNPAYMQCITSIECKNVTLSNPQSHLMLLLLTRLVTEGKAGVFWPELDCRGCQEFAESHHALAKDAPPVQIPEDGPGLELGIQPTNSLAVFRAEVERLFALIPPDNITPHASDSEKTVGPPRNTSRWYSTVYEDMKQLLIDLGHSDPRELNAIMHWATPIRNIMIQNWSQMVRHNLTLSTVTHFTKSFGVRRDREAGCATISSPDSADSRGYLLRRVARNLDAWMDALARSQIEQRARSLTIPRMIVISQIKVTTTDEGDTEEDDNDEDDTDEEDTDNGDSDNSSDSPDQGNDSAGPRGGAGAGGNSGSGSSGQGRSSGGGSSNARTKRSLEPTYFQGDNKRPRQHSDFQVVLNRLHLAFNCPGEQLLSDGFSHYFFIPMAESFTGVSGGAATNITAALPVSVPSGTVTPPRRGSLTSSISSGSGTSSGDTDAFWSPTSTVSSIHSLPLSSPQSSPVRPKGITTTRSTDNSLTQTTSQSIVELLSATSLIESRPQNALSIVDRAGVVLDTKVHQSTIGIVWAGKMYLGGLTSATKPLHIVVKLADWERDSKAPEGSETLHGKALRSEAKIYHHLVGSNIGPHFYGVFNNSGSIALVLEYKGKRLPDFVTLADDSKHKLYDRVCNLHALGVQHNDLAPRNVLVNKEGDLNIIDFHQSELKDFAEQLQMVV
ncbi:hypothetical protein EV368DRAFT_83809 [Lentinula lateritia]|nr:hypothetical protein EV368DRAFT_83809 [Lentinula lateritia]